MTEPVIQGSRSEDDYKSQYERQIARFLDKHHVRYRYEYPLAVVDRNKVRIYYPDFTLPDYGIIIETTCVNGDKNYERQTEHKKRIYEDMALSAIFLDAYSFSGYWPGKVLTSIEHILVERLENFRKRVPKGILTNRSDTSAQ